MAKYTSIGGQALIEGIMMKSPEKTAMAVRLPDGGIDVSYINERSLREKHKFFALPVVRGVVAFAESLIGGYKAMMKSAEISGFTDIEEESKEKKDENKPPKKESGAFMTAISIVSAVIGVALAIVLFMLIPRLAVSLLQRLAGKNFSSVLRSAIEQIIKLTVLVGYIWAVSLMKDIRRVFMYHGAEHKTIFCYEHKLKLTVENVKKEKRFHPRCGTSFMILMILVSFIVSTVVQILFKGVYENAAVWVVVKLVMVPLICGLGFEVLKICGRYDNVVTRVIAAPGMLLQRLTTREPDPDMIEIAIAALKACEPKIPDIDRAACDEEEENEHNDI